MERLTQRVKPIEDLWLLKNGKTKEMVTESNGYKEYFEKLADYEDLEEQGLLILLPCKIGTVLYVYSFFKGIIETKLKEYKYDKFSGLCMVFDLEEMRSFCVDELGISVVFTKEEAKEIWEVEPREAIEKLAEKNAERG